MTLFILADDLTGAADCAARCHYAGVAATVCLEPATHTQQRGALALTSDSRHLSAPQAAQRVGELMTSLQKQPGVIWYKKIDSTARGNIGAELDAMLDTLGCTTTVVCPAFPAQQRGLRDGYVITSSLAQQIHLPTLLGNQTRRRVASISLAEVRGGVSRVAKRLDVLQSQRASVLVVDAMNEMDLHVILDAVQRALPDTLLCGSAGLMGALASRYAPVRTPPPETDLIVEQQPGVGPALVAVGSGSAMAHSQLAYLRRCGLAEVVEAGTAFNVPAGRDIALHLPAPSPDVVLDSPAARRMAAYLGRSATQIIRDALPALLVLVGGDTAMSVLHELGLKCLHVLRELLPGMPLTRGEDADGRAQFVVLKAGNHGNEATLATLLQQARHLYA